MRIQVRLLGCCLGWVLLLLLWSVQPALAHGRGELPVDDLTYAAIGDSISAGWGAPLVNGARLNGYAAQLHRQLQVRGHAEFHNLGVPGLTSGQFLFLLDHWPDASAYLKKADLITLSVGGNDIIWTDHQAPGDAAKMREALSKYEANIDAILSRIRQVNPEARIFILEVYNPFPADDGRHGPLSEWVQTVNEAIATAANTHEADVVTTSSLFLGHEKEYVNLANNDIHPTVVGHMRIAEQISHVLFGSFVPLVVEAEMQPNLLWNGKPRAISPALVYENSTVYIASSQLLALHRDALQKMWVQVGQWWLRVNGRRVKLPSPVLFKDGQAFVPLRVVSESLGAKVYWVEDSRTISVVTKKEA